MFHADRCDIVGLLCVRKAKAGGLSRIVSAAVIHNEVLRRRPDLIDAFYADWYHSRQGDEQPGEARAYSKSSFGFREGHFTGLFSPTYMRSAQEFPGHAVARPKGERLKRKERKGRTKKCYSDRLDQLFQFRVLAVELRLELPGCGRRHHFAAVSGEACR
ncbi:MAG: hypothetical protein HY322_01575 [Betaproteobacteria bacterium]|nr:hypothetical protein [Betaproteobacteria bacterium]